MEPYLKTLSLLERNLEQLELQTPLDYQSAEKGIQLCRDALLCTRERVIKKGFKSGAEECAFFKTIKPVMVGNLIFYMHIIHLTLHKPVGSPKECNSFYREYMGHLGNYFLEHRELYQYYIGKLSHLDGEYFTRSATSTAWYCDSLTSLIDVHFSSAKDMVFAQIFGNLKTMEYLKREMAGNKKETENQTATATALKWTGSKVDLVELVYALHCSGSLNNGRAELKEIAETFESILQIKLGDYYRTFLEIRGRKIQTTKFLDHLKSRLERRMMEADG